MRLAISQAKILPSKNFDECEFASLKLDSPKFYHDEVSPRDNFRAKNIFYAINSITQSLLCKTIAMPNISKLKVYQEEMGNVQDLWHIYFFCTFKIIVTMFHRVPVGDVLFSMLSVSHNHVLYTIFLLEFESRVIIYVCLSVHLSVASFSISNYTFIKNMPGHTLHQMKELANSYLLKLFFFKNTKNLYELHLYDIVLFEKRST